jgi:hypothetical protein
MKRFSFEIGLVTGLLLALAVLFIPHTRAATTAPTFSQRCGTGKPQRADLVVDWFIQCINEMAVKVDAIESGAVDRSDVEAIAWAKAGDRWAVEWRAQLNRYKSYSKANGGDPELYDLLDWRWRRAVCAYKVPTGAPVVCPDRASP